MRVQETQQLHSDGTSRQSASSTEWQNLALDTLARLTRQFALHPDCIKLIDLVLLSMTGQLSTTGAFACFLSSLEAGQSTIYRGSGLLHRQDSLQGLLELTDHRQFFVDQAVPLKVSDLLENPTVPPGMVKLLGTTKVAAVVPMIIGESLLGVLGLARKVDRSEFSESDLSLLGTLSDTISPLLSNALLYARLDWLNQWHHDVMDSVLQGVLIFTDSFQLRQANAQAKQTLASLSEKVDGEDKVVLLADLFNEKVFPGWLEYIETAASQNEFQSAENLMARDSKGDRIFHVRVSRTSGKMSAESDIVITFDEITEQRNNELRMFEMEKFAEKGIMAASISHELNNHLALILGGIELAEIASVQRDFEKTKLSLEKLKKHSLTMERFTAGLTDYSRLNSELTEANLNTIVKDVVSFARVQKRFNSVHLNTRLATHIPTIKADIDQIAQLLINLLNNAADAIRDGKKENGIIEIVTSHDDSVVSLLVRDNGVGIPEYSKDKLFKSRFSTKDYGHGFGMVTCGRILEHHSARYSVESKPDQGTSIKIDFLID